MADYMGRELQWLRRAGPYTNLARLHDAHGLVLRVVRHGRRGVEQIVDPVPGVRADDRTTVGLAMLRDGVP